MPRFLLFNNRISMIWTLSLLKDAELMLHLLRETNAIILANISLILHLFLVQAISMSKSPWSVLLLPTRTNATPQRWGYGATKNSIVCVESFCSTSTPETFETDWCCSRSVVLHRGLAPWCPESFAPGTTPTKKTSWGRICTCPIRNAWRL